jgi:hypothetical protein
MIYILHKVLKAKSNKKQNVNILLFTTHERKFIEII